MSRYEKDFVSMMDGVDALLDRTDNPAHRAILTNYRRHGLLEVSGRYEEILAADMTVTHPVYHLTEGAKTLVLDGRDAVRKFYGGLVEVGANVMWTTQDEIAVADWGFASENVFYHFVPGRLLAADGEDIDDLDAIYLLVHRLAFHWPYRDGLLVGEHVYEDRATREIIKPDPADVISPDRAAALIAPLLDEPVLQ